MWFNVLKNKVVYSIKLFFFALLTNQKRHSLASFNCRRRRRRRRRCFMKNVKQTENNFLQRFTFKFRFCFALDLMKPCGTLIATTTCQ